MAAGTGVLGYTGADAGAHHPRPQLPSPQSHDNERRLVRKVKAMNSELAQMGSKVAQAMKLSADDDSTAAKLRKKVDTLYGMVDAANAQEEEARATVAKLQKEVTRLTEVVDSYTSMLGEDSSLEEVIAARNTLAQKHQEALHTIEYEQGRADELRLKLESAHTQHKEKKAVIGELKSQLRSKADEHVRELRKRESVETQMAELRKDLAERTRELQALKADLESAKTEAARNLLAVTEAQSEVKEQVMHVDEVESRNAALHKQIRDLQARCDTMTEAKMGADKELSAARLERSRVEGEKRRLAGKLKNAEGRIDRLKSGLDEQKLTESSLRSEVVSLQKQLDALAKDSTSKARQLGRLQMDYERGQEKLAGEAARVREAATSLEEEKAAARKQDEQLALFTRNAEKARNVIDKLTMQVQRHKAEVQAAQAATAAAKAQVSAAQATIKEGESKEAELMARLKQQQTLYESVRADRNMYSKQLIESQDEIAEMRRTFKVKQHQITQLKEDIGGKDRALMAEHYEKKGLSKMLQQREFENEELKKLLKESEASNEKLATELDELNAAIRRQDEEGEKQRQKLKEVVTQRDILGTQLIRRNDELALLFEKVHILQSQLQRGEATFGEKLDYIRMLKLKVADLTRELALAKKSSGRVEDLQRDTHRLHSELLQEKTKVKALSEELENPMNVHRWRKLEGSDPATYELIQKIQTLQKRLISKTEECVEKDLQLRERDKLYVELKGILARQPGPEVAEQLSMYQQKLSEKTRQLTSMAAELNMSTVHMNEVKFDKERLHRELQDTKQRFYQYKRRTQMLGSSAGGATHASEPGHATTAPLASTTGSAAVHPSGASVGAVSTQHFAAEGGLTAGLAATQRSKALAGSTRRFTGGGFSTHT